MPTSLADWKGVPPPSTTLLEGRFIRLEKLDPARHADDSVASLPGPGRRPQAVGLPALRPLYRTQRLQ